MSAGVGILAEAFAFAEGIVHEVTVALGLLEDVESAAAAEAIDRVVSVRVRIGAMAGIVRDALLFSWDVVTAQTICEGSRLDIEVIPLAIFCERCQGESTPSPGRGLLCAECGTVASRILRGREMQLVGVEVPA